MAAAIRLPFGLARDRGGHVRSLAHAQQIDDLHPRVAPVHEFFSKRLEATLQRDGASKGTLAVKQPQVLQPEPSCEPMPEQGWAVESFSKLLLLLGELGESLFVEREQLRVPLVELHQALHFLGNRRHHLRQLLCRRVLRRKTFKADQRSDIDLGDEKITEEIRGVDLDIPRGAVHESLVEQRTFAVSEREKKNLGEQMFAYRGHGHRWPGDETDPDAALVVTRVRKDPHRSIRLSRGRGNRTNRLRSSLEHGGRFELLDRPAESSQELLIRDRAGQRDDHSHVPAQVVTSGVKLADMLRRHLANRRGVTAGRVGKGVVLPEESRQHAPPDDPRPFVAREHLLVDGPLLLDRQLAGFFTPDHPEVADLPADLLVAVVREQEGIEVRVDRPEERVLPGGAVPRIDDVGLARVGGGANERHPRLCRKLFALSFPSPAASARRCVAPHGPTRAGY